MIKLKKDRLHEVMEAMHLSDYRVYTDVPEITKNMMVKLRNGETKEASINVLEPFFRFYSQVNPSYILTGDGNMFKDEQQNYVGESIENNDILLRIKAVIDHYGVSIASFAKMINFNQSNLSKIIRGDRPVPANLINSICQELDVPYNWIVNGEGSMFKEQNSAKPVGTYLNEKLTEVPMIDADAAATFIENMHNQHYTTDKYGVMQEDGEDLNNGNYAVFRVIGESMTPTIPDKAKVLARRIPEEKWEEVSGVVFVIYGKMFTIKRVLKNSLYTNNSLTLKADNPLYGQMDIERAEIRGIWQAVRIVSQKIV